MVRRLAIVCTALAVIFAVSLGGLWWRLSVGPINLDIASPWLAAALEDDISHGNTVEVGGTLIERAGRFGIAVRIRDIIVRDRDHAIIASAPKAEARLSGSALLLGRLRAESLTLVDAEITVRITPDGNVTVSAGGNARPLPDTFSRRTPPNASTQLNQLAVDNTRSGLLAALDWLDSLSPTGLDGQKLSEIGFKNSSLIVDDQERGKKLNFLNISLSLRRPSGGGVEFSLGDEGTQPWSVRARVGPAENGARSVGIRADRISTSNILLAMGVKDLTYSDNLPLSGELKGEIGRDGTSVEDIMIEGGGVSIKGALEVDQNGDLINANFPTFALSRGDKTSLQAECGPDGVIKVTVRGEVLDGRDFLKPAITGNFEDDSRMINLGKVDADVDLRLDAVLGFNGEVVRSVDAKMSRRGGTIRSFMSSGKLGRDTPITADLRAREGRAVFYLETDDAGAFLRFTDAYSKVIGGQLQLTIDAPTVEPGPREALLNVGDFTVKGEPSLDMLAADSSAGAQSGISFSRLRAKFIRQNGQLTIRDGILKGPRVGGTIEGDIDYPGNQVRIRGTLAPLYGLNNMFGQVPALGPAGGGGNEGLFGVTYEVVGTPGQPVFRVNPISAMAPSVLRKIFELNKNPNDLPPKN